MNGLLVLFLILVALLVMMDAFDHFGVTPRLNSFVFRLVIRLSGLDRSVTSITTAGLVLGLAYGGALIISRGNDPSISPQAKKYALYWLSLCHGLIEDVALMVAIGGGLLRAFCWPNSVNDCSYKVFDIPGKDIQKFLASMGNKLVSKQRQLVVELNQDHRDSTLKTEEAIIDIATPTGLGR